MICINMFYLSREDITKDGFKVVMTRQYGMKEKYPAIVGQRVSYVAIEKGLIKHFSCFTTAIK